MKLTVAFGVRRLSASRYLLVHPNLDDLVETFVPDQPLGILITGGLLFSMVNAAVEEGDGWWEQMSKRVKLR